MHYCYYLQQILLGKLEVWKNNNRPKFCQLVWGVEDHVKPLGYVSQYVVIEEILEYYIVDIHLDF